MKIIILAAYAISIALALPDQTGNLQILEAIKDVDLTGRYVETNIKLTIKNIGKTP
jgi:hypothetical protein